MKRRLIAALVMMSFSGLCQAVQETEAKPTPRTPQIDPLSRNFLNPFMDDFVTPAEAGVAIEEVAIMNSSGESLRAWFLPKPGATHTVMFCMGNTGNISCMLMYARILLDGGYNVLLFDYQGFGGSTGTATAMSLLSDSLCAFDYLTEARGLDAKSIGVFGVSLGSALAIAVAVEREAGAVCVEDVLLPNQKIEEARRQLPRDMATQLAISALKTLIIPRVDPLVTVPKLKCPLFLMHGENDRLLPPSGSIMVAQVAEVPTRLWIMQGAGHAPETLEVNDREYASQIQTFFQDAFAGTVSEPNVEFISTGADESWSTQVTFDSPERRPWHICLSSSNRRFHHFERRFVVGSFDEAIPTTFKPEHVSVIVFEHVRAEGDSSWVPDLSELSQELATFRAFEAAAWRDFEFIAKPRFRPFGFSRESIRTAESWQSIKERLPVATTISPRFRPRYGELLSYLYSELGSQEQDKAIAMLQAARSYLLENADDYYQLDNAGFRVGPKQQEWAFWTLVAIAREQHSKGELAEAKSTLRQALVYSNRPAFTAERIGELDAGDEYFPAIGFDYLSESSESYVPVSGGIIVPSFFRRRSQ